MIFCKIKKRDGLKIDSNYRKKFKLKEEKKLSTNTSQMLVEV